MRMMSPFRPLAKRDRLRKSGVLRFAGDGKPLQNNLRAGQQALSLVAIFVPSLTNTKQILQIMLDYKTISYQRPNIVMLNICATVCCLCYFLYFFQSGLIPEYGLDHLKIQNPNYLLPLQQGLVGYPQQTPPSPQ